MQFLNFLAILVLGFIHAHDGPHENQVTAKSFSKSAVKSDTTVSNGPVMHTLPFEEDHFLKRQGPPLTRHFQDEQFLKRQGPPFGHPHDLHHRGPSGFNLMVDEHLKGGYPGHHHHGHAKHHGVHPHSFMAQEDLSKGHSEHHGHSKKHHAVHHHDLHRKH